MENMAGEQTAICLCCVVSSLSLDPLPVFWLVGGGAGGLGKTVWPGDLSLLRRGCSCQDEAASHMNVYSHTGTMPVLCTTADLHTLPQEDGSSRSSSL